MTIFKIERVKLSTVIGVMDTIDAGKQIVYILINLIRNTVVLRIRLTLAMQAGLREEMEVEGLK